MKLLEKIFGTYKKRGISSGDWSKYGGYIDWEMAEYDRK